ncbi:MAG: hypothetical protein GY710_02765 [Desulfobacteraceae bacterium]|nr:hypothetical protein [Desulfobacteraceae bacterium]
MINHFKNESLIIGLTAPLGSGCSMTAKFLAGKSLNNQKTFNELIESKKNSLSLIDERIEELYKAIKDDKGFIKNRLIEGKNQSDDEVKIRKENIKKNFYDLMKELRKREIYKSLEEFYKKQGCKSIEFNDEEKKAFGLDPFAYISFSTMIFKLAIEEYWVSEKKNSWDNYFNTKKKSYNRCVSSKLSPFPKKISQLHRKISS